MEKESITIVAPVHTIDDIRVYKKEATSLIRAGYDVNMIVKDSSGIDNPIGARLVNLNYKNRIHRFLLQPFILYKAIKAESNYYHIHNPDTLLIGFVLTLLGKKVIYDTHENFAKKILIRKWIPKIIRPLISNCIYCLELFASKLFFGFIVTQISQNESLPNSTLVGNAPLFDASNVVEIKKTNNSECIELVFLGGVSMERGLKTMHQLLTSLNEMHKARLTIIGPFLDSETEDYYSQIMLDDTRVSRFDSMDQRQAFEYVQCSDFGIILFDDVADYSDICPNKLFEYMMNGVPFIASDFKVWKNYIGDCNAGIFYDPKQSINSFSKKIVDIYLDVKGHEEMRQNAFDFVSSTYNWELVDAPQLRKVYEERT